MSKYDETLKMKKYIVPVKDRVLEWKSFFEACFVDEEALDEAMHMFASMMSSFILDSHFNKTNLSPFVAALEKCLEVAQNHTDGGLVAPEFTEDVAQTAYEFTTGLTAYLKDVGVLKAPSTIKFEGFVGMDIIISIEEHDEKALREDICQSG